MKPTLKYYAILSFCAATIPLPYVISQERWVVGAWNWCIGCIVGAAYYKYIVREGKNPCTQIMSATHPVSKHSTNLHSICICDGKGYTQEPPKIEQGCVVEDAGEQVPCYMCELHSSTRALVLNFASALAEKLKRAELKYGYSNTWEHTDWKTECANKLMEHLRKGDPIDVAAYCAFMWHHGWNTERCFDGEWHVLATVLLENVELKKKLQELGN